MALVASFVLLLVLAACDGEGPEWVDPPAVAEALRLGADGLAEACESGFPGFLRGVEPLLAALPGAERERAALQAYLRPGRGLDPSSAPHPALLRLLLHRYAVVCRAPVAADRERRLAALAEGALDDQDELFEPLERLLDDLDIPGGQLDTPSAGAENRAFVLRIPATPSSSAGEADAGEGGAVEAAPVVLLTCLMCRSGLGVEGSRQIAAATAAIEALVATPVVRRHPIELVLCLDASRKPESCARGVLERDRPVAAAVALDGAEPLVVAWSAEVSWHLALPHEPPASPWLTLTRRRAAREPEAWTRPVIVDVGAPGTLEELPAAAWMDLVDPTGARSELLEAVEREVAAVGRERESARYEVSVVEERVRVTARAESLPAWEITERRNALWDLAAVSRALRVVDSPRGGAAAMLRAVARFDADPYGARLGMHYEDPLGGPLLVAPCTLSTRGGRVTLGFRLYRPPGLEREAFLARLDDARERLGFAARRPLIEAEREVGDPSRVAPDDPRVEVVRRALLEVTDEADPIEPTGSPRPGLGALLPDAVSIRLPTRSTAVAVDPALTLVVELLWQLTVATDPEVRRAAAWD